MLHPYTQGTWITATAPASRQLRQDYDAARAQEGLRVWESPDILSRDAWVARLWREYTYRDPLRTPLLLNRQQADVLWEKAIEASDAALGVSGALLDLPGTVAAAARAWDLLQAWEAPFDPAEFAQTADPAAFAGWKHAVERQLRENGWITWSQLPRVLAEAIASGKWPLAEPLSFTGFDELTSADRRLLEACHAIERPLPAAGGTPVARRMAFDDVIQELTQAAAWTRRKLAANPAARVGILVRGLASQRAVVERIFDDVLNPGITLSRPQTRGVFQILTGESLADTALISSALLALKLNTGLSLPEAGMLLRSPFTGITCAAGAGLEATLRRHGVESVSLHTDAVRRVFSHFAQAADASPSRQRPSQWSIAFSKLLAAAGWPGPRTLSPVECQALDEWKELLSGLASLDLVLPNIDYATALARLRRIARGRKFTEGDGGAPVQIIDILDAAGMRWDAVWMAGLHAGVWPEAPRPNPFLPVPLQRKTGMPHRSPESELVFARHITSLRLAAAPEAVCSYARFAGEEKLRVSPLIEGLPEVISAAEPSDTILHRVFATGAVMEPLPRDQAPPLPPGIEQGGGTSLLKNQAACPFRAFAIHRLRAREADSADLGISPADRGTVAHSALERLWRELKTQKELLRRSPDRIATLVSRCVAEALEERLGRRPVTLSLDRAQRLEQARWERLLHEWLEIERRREPFEVVEVEAKREVTAGGFKLQVKVDRIDQLADGSLAILDYKTSEKVTPKDWEGARPDEPQLLLYAVKSEPQPSAVHFAKLALGKVGLPGYSGAALAPYLKIWEPVIDELANSFARGDAAVDPKDPKTTCEFCHLKLLCRIGEWKGGAVPEDTDE